MGGGGVSQIGVSGLFWAWFPIWGLFEGFWRSRFAYGLCVEMVEVSGSGVFGAILGSKE